MIAVPRPFSLLNQRLHVLTTPTLRLYARSQSYSAMPTTIGSVRDPNTLSNYQNWVTTHTTTNLDIDFDRRILSGNVLLQLKASNEHEKPEILLDTSYIDIGRVKVNGQEAKYELISRFDPYGRALKIPVPPDHKSEGVELDVAI